jgi:hypothetical protein
MMPPKKRSKIGYRQKRRKIGKRQELGRLGQKKQKQTPSQMKDAKKSVTVSDPLFHFLSQVSPLSLVEPGKEAQREKELVTLIYVSGNWYDEFKVSALVGLAEQFPTSKLIVSGGTGRLTLPKVKKLGGEPIYLRDRLVEEGVSAPRIIICNSSIVTTHNVNFLLYYLQQCCDIERWPKKKLRREYQIFVVDESFLLRRLKATVANALKQAVEKRNVLPFDMVREIVFVASGSKNCKEMVHAHRGGESVAAWLLLGEWKRLHEYSKPNGLELYTKKQAFDGLADDEEFAKLGKEASAIEERYQGAIDRFRSMVGPNELLEATRPVFSTGNLDYYI